MAKQAVLEGSIRFEVPFGSEPPPLTSRAVGLRRLVRRPAGSYSMDCTVLDASDGRLLRAGVVVAHRVINGTGQWYLSAPSWDPHLPAEQVEPMSGTIELPERFSRLVKPLARNAVMEPIAVMSCKRDEWALRDDDDETVAVVRDELVRVHRDGDLSSQYREVTFTPKASLTGQQREFLLSAAQAAGSTVVRQFPTTQQRLGAPATGLSGFPTPRELSPQATLEEFVTAIFAEHLGCIVRADLDRRASGSDDVSALNQCLWQFGRDLRGLALVLEPSWREGVESLLRGLPFAAVEDVEQPTLDVIDALVLGARAPKLGDLSQQSAAAVLVERAEQATYILGDRCRSLTAQSPNEAWQAALRAAEQLQVAANVSLPLMPKVMGKLVDLLEDVLGDLRVANKGVRAGAPELDGLSPEQAYQLGQDSERSRSTADEYRRAFIAKWPARAAEARELIAKTKKKQAKRLKKHQI